MTGGSLIVAIGAQNAYVLRQGLTRSHTAAVVAVCSVSDVVLIVAGVAGVGTVVAHAGWVIDAVTWFGVAFLLWYAAGSLRRAFHPASLTARIEPAAAEPRGRVLGRAAALTWLNPHVYLDTVVLLGSVGNAHGQARWAFAAGAILGSRLWFTALGVAARALAPVFARPIAWRVLDGIIAVVMTCVATGLVVGG
jgi:L-lysine exporter family protein LysE/ArgO